MRADDSDELSDYPAQPSGGLPRLGDGPRFGVGPRFGDGPRFGVGQRAALAAGLVALLGLLAGAWLALKPVPEQELPPRAAPITLTSDTGSPAGVTPGPDPAVTVSGTAGSSPGAGSALTVYIVGQVRDPGVVSLLTGARVVDAIQAAGGATRHADLTALNLARKVADGEQIVVPRPGQVVSGQLGTGQEPSPGAAADILNLNSASEAQFDELPGVGPVIAGRIVAWREQNGPFASVDQLGEVEGIGDATLAKLRPLVTV